MPPKMAVTTVDAPFLDKPHQRSTVSQKPELNSQHLFGAHISQCLAKPMEQGLGALGRMGTAAAQGHITHIWCLHCFILDLKKG